MTITEVLRTPEGAVIIDYEDLISGADLSTAIQEAFGSEPHCLGLILVKNLPSSYPALRRRLLELATTFTLLPENEKAKVVDPTSNYSFGWSHGKEIMNGKPDLLKGSYYNNPITNNPVATDSLRAQFPESCNPNIWPRDALPELETAFMELGAFIVQVGSHLARSCDHFVSSKLKDYREDYLYNVVTTSQTHKARLLRYFPSSANGVTTTSDDQKSPDSWCGWHCDHSSLTGLTSAMFLNEGSPENSLQEISSPDPSSGLYIRNRGGNIVQARIPRDMLAFQTGEALQVSTKEWLGATPHCVRGVGPQWSGIGRNTFAVFMQPNMTEDLGNGKTFAEFSREKIGSHYEPTSAEIKA